MGLRYCARRTRLVLSGCILAFMATHFRVHPDVSNRDIFDPESRLYDQDFNEVTPEIVQGNDVLVTLTPEQFDLMVASRQ